RVLPPGARAPRAAPARTARRAAGARGVRLRGGAARRVRRLVGRVHARRRGVVGVRGDGALSAAALTRLPEAAWAPGASRVRPASSRAAPWATGAGAWWSW